MLRFLGVWLQARHLPRHRCLGRSCRDIIDTEKLEKMLRRDKRDPFLGFTLKRPPRTATQSESFLQHFPREFLDWSFEEVEAEAKTAGRQGDRARAALRRLMSPVFDKPR